LVELYHFVKEGANLNPEAKEKAKINGELASYFSTFSQNLLAEENNEYVALNNQGDFDGLPEGLRKAAMAQAKERNLNVLCDRQYAFICGTVPDFSNDRELRAKVWSMYVKVTMKMNSTIKPPYRFCSWQKSKITWFPYFTLEPEQ
jgi:peptidyl-dipeptidase Dcp